MAYTLKNEYSLYKTLRGHTEWGVTFPTVAFHLEEQAGKPEELINFTDPKENHSISFDIYNSEGLSVPKPCAWFHGHYCESDYFPSIRYLTQYTALYSFSITGSRNNFLATLGYPERENIYNFNVNADYLVVWSDKQSIADQEGYIQLSPTKNGEDFHPHGTSTPAPKAFLTGINTDTGMEQTYHGLPLIGFAVHFSYNDAINSVYSRSENHKMTRHITEGENN